MVLPKYIKNWNLVTDVLPDYTFHDSVIKRFDLNGDTIMLTINTCYKWGNECCYDITIKFSELIRFNYEAEIGNDYGDGINIVPDKCFKNLVCFTLESAHLEIQAFKVEVVSVEESPGFQRNMICLDDPNMKGLEDANVSTKGDPIPL